MVCEMKDLAVNFQQRRGRPDNCQWGGRVLDPDEGSSTLWLRGLAHPNVGSDHWGSPWRDIANPGL